MKTVLLCSRIGSLGSEYDNLTGSRPTFEPLATAPSPVVVLPRAGSVVVVRCRSHAARLSRWRAVGHDFNND